MFQTIIDKLNDLLFEAQCNTLELPSWNVLVARKRKVILVLVFYQNTALNVVRN